MSEICERSYEKITKKDLKRLLRLSQKNLNDFFEMNPQYKPFKGKKALVVLAQGAALHYLDRKSGVKDFDVWFFYPSKKNLTLPYRRRGTMDFGKSKFGRHSKDVDFEGRCVDVLIRSDAAFNSKDPVRGINIYLQNKGSKTSKLLAQKAMIGLWPERLLGMQLWPPS